MSYYCGRYIVASAASANLPIRPMDEEVHSKEAIEYHLREARHRSRLLEILQLAFKSDRVG